MSKKRQRRLRWQRSVQIRTLSHDYSGGHYVTPHQHATHQLVYAASGVMTVSTPHALRLLAGGQAVTTVALEAGYGGPSAFVHAFRQTFGSTPGRYFRSSARS